MRAPALIAILALAGCKAELDTHPWLVDSPRVLAVRSTPAEAAPGQLVTLEVLALGVDPSCGELRPVTLLAVSAIEPSD